MSPASGGFKSFPDPSEELASASFAPIQQTAYHASRGCEVSGACPSPRAITMWSYQERFSSRVPPKKPRSPRRARKLWAPGLMEKRGQPLIQVRQGWAHDPVALFWRRSRLGNVRIFQRASPTTKGRRAAIQRRAHRQHPIQGGERNKYALGSYTLRVLRTANEKRCGRESNLRRGDGVEPTAQTSPAAAIAFARPLLQFIKPALARTASRSQHSRILC